MKKIPLSKLYFLTTLLLVLAQCVFAQQTRRQFQGDYDAKAMKFGYFLGLTNSNFKVKFNNYFVNKDNYYSITSPSIFGLKMGGLVNFRINDYFDFRVLPTVAIYSRKIDYKFIDTTLPDGDPKRFGETAQSRETAWFEIPLMLKYKSERRRNVRAYVFGGVRYGVETNPVNKKKKQQFITKGNDFSIEYGTGIEFFREYFKFAPEITFSHGINNLVDPANNRNTPLAGVAKLNTHSVTLCLLFE